MGLNWSVPLPPAAHQHHHCVNSPNHPLVGKTIREIDESAANRWGEDGRREASVAISEVGRGRCHIVTSVDMVVLNRRDDVDLRDLPYDMCLVHCLSDKGEPGYFEIALDEMLTLIAQGKAWNWELV